MPTLGSHHRWRNREAGNDEVGNDEVGNAVKKTSAALLAVPLVASMLLSGCGGSGKADASHSTTATSSPTSTVPPTTSAPTSSTASPTADPNIPAAARAHTTAGAEAFVRYFYGRGLRPLLLRTSQHGMDEAERGSHHGSLFVRLQELRCA